MLQLDPSRSHELCRVGQYMQAYWMRQWGFSRGVWSRPLPAGLTRRRFGSISKRCSSGSAIWSNNCADTSRPLCREPLRWELRHGPTNNILRQTHSVPAPPYGGVMKIASVAEVKVRLSAYLKASVTGPVVVTRNGKAVAVLLGIHDDDDLERLLLAHSRKLRAILDSADRRIDKGAGIGHDEFWHQVESANRARGRDGGGKQARSKRET